LQQNSIDGAGRPEKLWHYPALGLFCLVIKRGFPIRRMFMQYHAKVIDPIKHRSHCLLVGCYQDGILLQDAAAVDKAGAGQLQQLIKREKFQGKSGQALLLLNPQGVGDIPAGGVLEYLQGFLQRGAVILRRDRAFIGLAEADQQQAGAVAPVALGVGGSVRVVRTAIEVAVVVTGFVLGGTLGAVTVLYALAIGPLTQLFLPFLSVRVAAQRQREPPRR
jgi:hypothetical protein